MAKSITVVIVGYYGFGNLGDEAIRFALLQSLNKYNGVESIVLTANPQTRNEISRNNPIRILGAIRRSSILLFGGGGLLQNRTSNRSLFYYLSLILLARIARRPVYLIGQGIGPIRGKLAQLVTRLTLKQVRHIDCRDQESLSYVNSLGLNGTQGSDLLFLLPPSPHHSRLTQSPPRIVLSLKGLPRKQQAGFIEQAIRLLKELRSQRGVSCVFLPFFPKQDLALARAISSECGFSCQILRATGVDQAERVISSASVLVSSRLHPLEFALRTGTPMFAIPEDPKIERFVHEVHSRDGPCIPCGSFPSVEETSLLLDHPPASDSLRKTYRQLHETRKQTFKLLLDGLYHDLEGKDV